MRVLVTGGTGFIGQYFIPELINKGYNVRLLVRNIKKAKKMFGEKCEYCVGDVTDIKSLSGCCDNIDIVYHMVAKVGNQLPSSEELKRFRDVNVEGTRNMMYISEKAKVKKFIFVSSIAAMGIVNEVPINEDSKCNPYLPYQITKYEAEKLLIEEYRKSSFPCIILRPTKVYGVGEHEYSYLLLVKLCQKGILPKVSSKTSNIYITDLVQGLILAAKYGKIGEKYILTSNGSISFIDEIKEISKTIGKSVRFLYIPKWIMILAAAIIERAFLLINKTPPITKRNVQSTLSERVYDISKAKTELTYNPKVSLEVGIQKVTEWYLENKLL